jgi:hypothetical protein
MSFMSVRDMDGPPTYDEVENMEKSAEYYKVSVGRKAPVTT